MRCPALFIMASGLKKPQVPEGLLGTAKRLFLMRYTCMTGHVHCCLQVADQYHIHRPWICLLSQLLSGHVEIVGCLLS